MKKTEYKKILIPSTERQSTVEFFLHLREEFAESFYFKSNSTHKTQNENSSSASTILGVGPFEYLQAEGERSILYRLQGSQKKVLEKLDKSFFQVLEEKIKTLKINEAPSSQPQFRFQKGGLFGCIGYDCIAAIEPKLVKKGYFQQLAKQTPNSSLTESPAEIIIAKRLIVFEHKENCIHIVDASEDENNDFIPQIEHFIERYFSLKCSEEYGFIDYPSNDKNSLKQTSWKSQGVTDDGNDTSTIYGIADKISEDVKKLELSKERLTASLGFEEFQERARKIKEHIQKGNIFQAVLAERFECQTTTSAIKIFSTLCELNPAPYHFYFPFLEREFLGASPETFLRVENRSMRTHPIAGTRPRGTDALSDSKLEKQLLRSRKENAEHLMLVDLARNDIGRVATPGSVQVAEFRQIQKLTHVMHLVSTVNGDLHPSYSTLDAFKACFPAGTLSGAPKIRAMEILSELEKSPRGFYGGAVVAFDGHGGLDSCIAIRSLEKKGSTAILRAGAGFVADSRVEKEYEEIFHKIRLLRQSIAIAEYLESQSPKEDLL